MALPAALDSLQDNRYKRGDDLVNEQPDDLAEEQEHDELLGLVFVIFLVPRMSRNVELPRRHPSMGGALTRSGRFLRCKVLRQPENPGQTPTTEQQ